MPHNVVAHAACRALMGFDSHMSVSREKYMYLTDIYFVNIQKEITTCMVNTFKQFLQMSSPPASTYEHVLINISISRLLLSNNNYVSFCEIKFFWFLQMQADD